MIEKWIDIIDHKDYQVSNLGKIKSLKFNKELILKPRKNSNGYLYVNLSADGKYKSIMVHKLVAIAFLNHKPDGTHKIVVDHIDDNKLNNFLSNIRLISQRENSIKNRINKTGYTGVCLSSDKKKYVASITNGRKTKHLGTFNNKLDAHKEYLKACYYVLE